MRKEAAVWMLILGYLTGSAWAHSSWWEHVKQARKAYRQKHDLESQQLYTQALRELEQARSLNDSAEQHSLEGLMPDMTKPFSRAHRDGVTKQANALFHRQQLDLIERLTAVQKRLLGPNHKATLDSKKHLEFTRKLYQSLDK